MLKGDDGQGMAIREKTTSPSNGEPVEAVGGAGAAVGCEAVGVEQVVLAMRGASIP